MARFIGLDIGARTVRAALIVTRYRKVAIERLEEVAILGNDRDAVAAAITAAASHLLPHTDGLATAIGGDLVFIHRLTLPASAAKRLTEVLPFELEAHVPVELSELAYDHRLLRRASNDAPIEVLVAAARIEHLAARVELVRDALGREPDRLASGSMALANLASVIPALRVPGPIAMVDLGGLRTEVTLLQLGEPVWVRTLSRGVEGLPAAAGPLASELKQTLLAWASSHGSSIERLYLVGGGSQAEGASAFLAHELGLPIETLPPLEVDGLSPELVASAPRFAKAISLALGSAGRGHDVDLRRGPLAFQRGFGFLKEKAPILLGLVAATLVSFVFATWAEVRGLGREHDALVERLAAVSNRVLLEPVEDAESATGLLEKSRAQDDADPLPHMDAFDVIVEISKIVPTTVTHDIEDFDMQRGHVKLHGVVGSAEEAQNVANEIGKHRCVSAAKIGKITQVVNSDRQKYVLEFDVKCPEDGPKKKKKPDETAEKAGEQAEGKAP
jgi:general secretion pathway protein L